MTYEEIKKKYAEPARAHATKIRLAKNKVERLELVVKQAEKDYHAAGQERNRHICQETKIATENALNFLRKTTEMLEKARKELGEVETGATINEVVKSW